MKLWQKILLVIILFFYIYFRITPIINQTVPYTYDQGRDFLKAEEIVKTGNIPFIGPTTGLEGIFHGPYIYYFLTIPYLIFQGWPLGFYYFIFFINIFINLLFFYFLLKNFNFYIGIIYLLITLKPDYFLTKAFYVGNDHLAPIFIIFFIISFFNYSKNKDLKWIFFVGLSTGFIFESEVAFGLFLIPSVLISFLFIEKREINLKKIFHLLLGFLIPLIPKIFFEIKNNFLQTKAFFNNLIIQSTEKNFSFLFSLKERLNLFLNFFTDIFDKNIFMSLLFFIFSIITFIFYFKKINKSIKKFLYFIFYIILLLFLSSLIYKNIFYSYYFNGIQFFYLIIILISVFYLYKNKKILFYLLFLILIINNLFFIKNIFNKKLKNDLIGLKADSQIINYLVQRTKNKDFCLKIYTPPVIPYTYQYLLSYYSQKNQIKIPKNDFYEDKCYMIIDYDEYKFRIDEWRKNNIPDTAKLIDKKNFENKTTIELYEKN